MTSFSKVHGVSLRNNKDILKRAEEELEKMKQEVEANEKKKGEKGSKIATALSLVAITASAIPTGGASLIALPGVAAGRAVGGWLGRILGGDPEQKKKEIEDRTLTIATLKDSITTAERMLEQLATIRKKAQNATHAESIFSEDELRYLKMALESDYIEVLEEAEKTKGDAVRIPNFNKEYETINGKPISTFEAIDLVLSDLASKIPDVQILALKRLYFLECEKSGTIFHSKKVYHQYLHSVHPQVQAAALDMMRCIPELQPDDREFVSTLEHFLVSGNPLLMEAALDAVLDTNFKSGSINYQLKKLSSPANTYDERLRTKAANALQKRYEQGTARILNSDESTKNILETIVGNMHLRRALRRAILIFQGSLDDVSNQGPSLFLYLWGPPGTGKTTIVSRLQEHVNQDYLGLIRLPMPEIKTVQDIITRLRENSPLQGKTIFFDEFQALDNIDPSDEQARVIEFLKVVFATEEDSTKGISVSQLLKEEYDLDLQDTILAIATNIDLNKMHSLGEGKVGEALKKRIEAISVPLIMNADLRDHIPEFVARFAPFKFYSYASTRRFEDNLQISESAQAQFIEDLTYETKHLSNVSGRDLTMKMVNAINATLAAYEEETKLMLERNRIGKIIQALTIDVDNNSNFIVVPIEGNQQNLGSSHVEYASSHFDDTIKSYAIRGRNQ